MMYKHARAVRGVSFVYGRETRREVAKGKPKKRGKITIKKCRPKKHRGFSNAKAKLRLQSMKLADAQAAIHATEKQTVVPDTRKESPKPSRKQRAIAKSIQGDRERLAKRGRKTYSFVVEVKEQISRRDTRRPV